MTETPPSKCPRVSILLPAFNAERTLGDAITSVLAQTFGEFELLVLNDGSSDRTAEIVTGFADPRVKLLGDRDRVGLAGRLNQGIAAAQGEYIARMDADDLCFPERLRLQVEYLDSHPDVDLVGGAVVVFRDGGPIIGMLPTPPTHAQITARPWRSIPLPHPTWMGRAEWFRRHRYRKPEVMRAEDQELLLRALPDSRYACIEQPVLAYRQGTFGLRRTWLARRALLVAQLELFLRRGQGVNAVLALAVAAVKVMIDVLAAMPGCDRIFFMRMGGTVPHEAMDQLKKWHIACDGNGSHD